MFGPEQGAWLKIFDAEYDNVRIALDWLLEQEEAGAGSATGSSHGPLLVSPRVLCRGQKLEPSEHLRPVPPIAKATVVRCSLVDGWRFSMATMRAPSA